MKYTLGDFNSIFNKDKVTGDNLLAESGLTVQSFHIDKDSGIAESYDTNNPYYHNHIAIFLVMTGSVEFCLGDEKVVVRAGQSISVNMDRNMSLWALEDSNLFGIHNSVEPEVDKSHLELVEAVNKVELDDTYLKGHNYRVGKYSLLLMQALDPSKATAGFNMCAAYHDVGKVIVPEGILNKEGKLTDEEFAEIKKHPAESERILKDHIGDELSRFVRWHHEKLDGSGYPDGLKGDQIPFESRVIAVADIFDALTTNRVYRKAYSFRRALDIIEMETAQGKLDERVTDALQKLVFSGVIVEGVDNLLKDDNSVVHYDGFTLGDIVNALSASGTGMWKLENEPGRRPRLYGDDVMNELVGVPQNTSPEERFDFFMSRIYAEDRNSFRSFYDNISRDQSEIICRYDHPRYGLIYVRCGGKRDRNAVDYKCFLGFLQNINSTVIVEQEKRRHFTEEAELYRKMSAKLMESFFTTAFYIDLAEKKYTMLSCNDDLIRNVSGYDNIGRAYSSRMPAKAAKFFMKHASMEHLQEVFRNRDEYTFSVNIYGEGQELRRITMWYYAIDEAHRYILATSQDTTEDFRREQKLAEALAEADRANMAKSGFLSTMSHDIRTPMNAIIGFTKLAKKNLYDKEKTLEFLDKIDISSDHLLSLINDFLDLSRIESGRMEISEAPTSVREITEDLKTIFTNQAADKGLEFRVENKVPEDMDRVFCDKLRVSRVLLNCLSNAIKFTEAGGRVELTADMPPARPDRKKTRIYRFTVKDTGLGMSKEFQSVIFEPFTREESAAVRGIQGTGLGMAICSRLVGLMGGRIELDSELGRGTRFDILLPLKQCSAEKYADEETDGTDFSENMLKGRRILIAEDNELNCEIATAILKEAGAEVECAADGQEALNKMQASAPGYYDCILMDIQMPVMNGYEAAEAIRMLDRPDAAVIPILAMTANAFDEDRKHAIAAGMNDHIAKPIDIRALFKTLGRFLG